MRKQLLLLYYGDWIMIITLIVAFLLFIWRLTRKKDVSVQENFTDGKKLLFQRCEQYGLSGAVQKIFDENGIEKARDPDGWDIYLPCGYTSVEFELPKVKISNKEQIVFGIKGCDRMVAKNGLWELMQQKYGRDGAKQYVPETFLLDSPKEMELFQSQYNPDDVYIMKKNLQRQEGLKLVKGWDSIMSAAKEGDYRLVQELLKRPFQVNGRKINMRVYLLVICRPTEGGSKKTAYVYKNGFMYYTPKSYIVNSLERDVNITSGYVPRQVYQENPLSHEDFRQWLQMNGYNSEKLFSNINRLMARTMDAVHENLCTLPSLAQNTTFQLFGVDVAPDESLDVKLIEINKGPDLGAKDERDGRIKYEVEEDTFALLNAVKIDRPNGFIEIWTN